MTEMISWTKIQESVSNELSSHKLSVHCGYSILLLLLVMADLYMIAIGRASAFVAVGSILPLSHKLICILSLVVDFVVLYFALHNLHTGRWWFYSRGILSGLLHFKTTHLQLQHYAIAAVSALGSIIIFLPLLDSFRLTPFFSSNISGLVSFITSIFLLIMCVSLTVFIAMTVVAASESRGFLIWILIGFPFCLLIVDITLPTNFAVIYNEIGNIPVMSGIAFLALTGIYGLGQIIHLDREAIRLEFEITAKKNDDPLNNDPSFVEYNGCKLGPEMPVQIKLLFYDYGLHVLVFDSYIDNKYFRLTHKNDEIYALNHYIKIWNISVLKKHIKNDKEEYSNNYIKASISIYCLSENENTDVTNKYLEKVLTIAEQYIFKAEEELATFLKEKLNNSFSELINEKLSSNDTVKIGTIDISEPIKSIRSLQADREKNMEEIIPFPNKNELLSLPSIIESIVQFFKAATDDIKKGIIPYSPDIRGELDIARSRLQLSEERITSNRRFAQSYTEIVKAINSYCSETADFQKKLHSMWINEIKSEILTKVDGYGKNESDNLKRLLELVGFRLKVDKIELTEDITQKLNEMSNIYNKYVDIRDEAHTAINSAIKTDDERKTSREDMIIQSVLSSPFLTPDQKEVISFLLKEKTVNTIVTEISTENGITMIIAKDGGQPQARKLIPPNKPFKKKPDEPV